MPWKDSKPMDQRVLFIADYMRELHSFSELCTRFGVSRKTGYLLADEHVGVEPVGDGGMTLCALTRQGGCETQS